MGSGHEPNLPERDSIKSRAALFDRRAEGVGAVHANAVRAPVPEGLISPERNKGVAREGGEGCVLGLGGQDALNSGDQRAEVFGHGVPDYADVDVEVGV